MGITVGSNMGSTLPQLALPLCPAPDMDVFGVLRNLPGEVEMLLGETLPNGHIRLG